MAGRMNPWLSMWIRPRSTLRVILQTNPRYGIFYLAAIYALYNFFYFANYWSVGISTRFYVILTLGIVLSPVLGLIWLYFSSWVLYFTGKWLQGRAPMLHLRTALAWSKIPTVLNLLMWFALILAYPGYVFILDAGGLSSLFVNIITLILGIWSFILLIQAIREVQFFTTTRAVLNVALAWLISTLFFCVFFSILRFFYLLTV